MKQARVMMISLACCGLVTALLPACKEERGELKRIWYDGSYNRDFNDLNDVHLAIAQEIGNEPVSSREAASKA